MKDVDAPRWAILVRATATAVCLAEVLLFCLGISPAFGGVATAIVDDPTDPVTALEQANPLALVFFGAVGLPVWQLGSAYALYLTLPGVTARRTARRIQAPEPGRIGTRL